MSNIITRIWRRIEIGYTLCTLPSKKNPVLLLTQSLIVSGDVEIKVRFRGYLSVLIHMLLVAPWSLGFCNVRHLEWPME